MNFRLIFRFELFVYHHDFVSGREIIDISAGIFTFLVFNIKFLARYPRDFALRCARDRSRHYPPLADVVERSAGLLPVEGEIRQLPRGRTRTTTADLRGPVEPRSETTEHALQGGVRPVWIFSPEDRRAPGFQC